MAKTSYDTETESPRRAPVNPLIWLAVVGILALVMLIIGFMCFSITTIHGNQVGVKETWSGGVVEQVFQPKTYVLGPTEKMYPYDVSSQVFVMNDKPMATEKGAGREKDSYLVQSMEGQDMRISMNLRWRRDPAKIVNLHKTVRNDIEEKIIRPVLMRVVKDEATRMKAIEAYSGEGLVTLQKNIQSSLSGTGDGDGNELVKRGVIIENFVIEHIELDPEYISQIKGKQIAQQQQLAAVEKRKAADAEALVAQALAMADYNKKVVEAQRDATNVVIAAQAENEKAIIAARAEQQKQTLEAEGKKAAMIATAEGTLAMGKAEAAAKELMLKAYAVQGSEAWVKVEVAKQLGSAFGGIKGYLPADMKVNLLTDNFVKAVDTMTGSPVVTVKQ